MEETMKARAARHFSDAADALVGACRELESCGLEDEPVERLLLALEDVTRKVHQFYPPPQRLQTEPADVARPGCHLPFQP